MNYAEYLLTLPMAQFKAIKKAVAMLVRTGMYREDAIRIIVEQHQSNGQRLRKVS